MGGKTISLVLGSGGARGLAHIGIIHWLEEHGYAIRSIAGSSMGALVGGIHAAGRLDEYVRWVKAITRFDILRLLDLSLDGGGLVKGDRIIDTLQGLVGARRIEELPVSFTAVASNIANRKEVWLTSGPLFDAIRASIALPLFFTPFEINGVKLVDGGILNPVPIAPTFRDDTDLTVAVNLGGPPEPGGTPTTAASTVATALPLHQRIVDFITELQGTRKVTAGIDWGLYDIAYQSFDAMQGTIARQKLAAYPPDVLIEIPRNVCRTLEFDRAEEMIDLGYRKAAETLSAR